MALAVQAGAAAAVLAIEDGAGVPALEAASSDDLAVSVVVRSASALAVDVGDQVDVPALRAGLALDLDRVGVGRDDPAGKSRRDLAQRAPFRPRAAPLEARGGDVLAVLANE